MQIVMENVEALKWCFSNVKGENKIQRIFNLNQLRLYSTFKSQNHACYKW